MIFTTSLAFDFVFLRSKSRVEQRRSVVGVLPPFVEIFVAPLLLLLIEIALDDEDRHRLVLRLVLALLVEI